MWDYNRAVEGYDGDNELTEEGIDWKMSFLESGNDPEYLVLGIFSTADQTRRYWPSARMIVSNLSNSLRRVEENVITGVSA